MITIHLSLFAILIASTVAALPGSENRRNARLARRTSGRASKPLVPTESLQPGVSGSSDVDYSSNWAGCVISEPAVRFPTASLLARR